MWVEICRAALDKLKRKWMFFEEDDLVNCESYDDLNDQFRLIEKVLWDDNFDESTSKHIIKLFTKLCD